MKFIDNDKEHHQVLYELGIIEYDEDWNLYQKMRDKEFDNVDIETWCKYTGIIPRKVPKE